MICKNCKKEIHDGNKFCPFCGEKVLSEEYIENNVIADELPQVQGMSEISKQDSSFESTDTHNIKPKQKNNSGKGKGVIVGVIVILVVVICAGIFIVNSNRKNIDVDLIEIMYEPEFAGYEGEGFLDFAPFVDKNKVNGFVSQIEDEDQAQKIEDFLSAVEYEVNKTEALSSGDEVEITANYDEKIAKELNLNIVNESTLIEIELKTDDLEVRGYKCIVDGTNAYMTDGNSIHKVDLETKEVVKITEELGYVDELKLCNGSIFYESHGNGISVTNKIYKYDLETHENTIVASDVMSYHFVLYGDGSISYESVENADYYDPNSTPIIVVTIEPDGETWSSYSKLSEWEETKNCNEKGYRYYTESTNKELYEYNVFLETPDDVILVTTEQLI